MVTKKIQLKKVPTKKKVATVQRRVAGSTLSQTKSPKKKTSKKVATGASKVLKNKRTSFTAKISAGSALSQSKTKKVTSSRVATVASKVLRPAKTGKVSRSAAVKTVRKVIKERAALAEKRVTKKRQRRKSRLPVERKKK